MSDNDEPFNFEKSFKMFYHDNDYTGAQIGVNVDGRLGFLRGYGHDHNLKDIHSETVLPVSAASKAFTALAVLKLVEEGRLNLQATVFGENGILRRLQPWKPENVDKRIYDITVDHLLRHNGGWDYQRSQIYDPVLNIALLERGYKVKNIADEMDLPKPIEPESVIAYMMSQRLDFTPGTKSAISNLGYIILGKVIQEVSNMPYNIYVKEKILDPCGLMHTKIGQPRVYKDEKGENDPVFQGYGEILPIFVDSALGWQSNVADLSRLFMCIDGSGDFQVLNRTSIETLMAKPVAVPVQHSSAWIGAGFHVNNHGAIWINGEYYTDDIVFYHKGPLLEDAQHSRNGYHRRARSWVVLLHGQTQLPIRDVLKRLVSAAGTDWPADVNHFTDDVADITAQVGAVKRIIRLKVNEHHLTSFVNAAKQLRYDIKWMNGFIHENQTWFTVLAQKVPWQVYPRMQVIHGLNERELRHRKIVEEKLGYNLTFFQNYRSKSHNNKRRFITIFRAHAYNNHTKIKYGLEHFTQPYNKLLGLFVEEGYYPTAQSLVYDGVDGLVSFVLEKDLDARDHKDFKAYDDLNLNRLPKIVEANARYRRKLYYLDASDYFGKPRFSAVFMKDKNRIMTFNAELTEAGMRTMIQREEANGFLPSIMAGYTHKNKDLRYALYLEK